MAFASLLLSVVLAGCGGGGSDPAGTDYSIGGTISGLSGTVVLQNSGGNNLSRSANGNFRFTTRLATGSSYAVSVLTPPAGQSCAVTNGSGTVASSDVTNVQVVCQALATGATNANLTSLTLSSGTLNQAFVASQQLYTSTQAFPVSSLQVTPAAEASGATIQVNGTTVISGQASQAIALAAGAITTINVVVTASNGTTTRTYSIDVTRQSGSGFAQQAYIKASNPDGTASSANGFGDQFGYATALSGDGNTLAVGATYEGSNATGVNGDQANNLAGESGAVYVFTRSAGVWTQQAYVKASNTGEGDGFGQTVALSSDGNTLAVGAPREDSAATGVNGNQASNTATNSGAVYVFSRAGSTWSQQAYLKASNTGATFDELDFFGWSVSLSGNGDTLAVGAPGEGSNATGFNGDQSNNSALHSGAVYVFARTGGNWAQQVYVKASNSATGDGLGSRVRLSTDGNTLVAAATSEDSNATGINGDQTNNAASASGAVYVFARTSGVWSQEAYIKASNTGAGDEFGYSIALSGDGNTLAVAANLEDSNATGINGDQANNSSSGSGAVYVFARSGSAWTLQAYVKASNAAAGDSFGGSVDLSSDGSTLVVTAQEEDSNAIGVGGDQANNSAVGSGAAYVFKRTITTWAQRAYVKASNTETGDRFGISVALSGDGDTLVVGADAEDGTAAGINGDQATNTRTSSGATYVFSGVSGS